MEFNNNNNNNFEIYYLSITYFYKVGPGEVHTAVYILIYDQEIDCVTHTHQLQIHAMLSSVAVR